MRMTLAACVLFAVSGAWWPAARADVIHLKGGKLEGKVVARADGRVTIRTASGITTTVDESEVLAVEETRTALDVYKSMAAALKPDDVDGRYALALWCRDRGLKDEMTAELVAVLRADPEHDGARTDLGYIKTDKGWVSRDDAMRAKGMVLVGGRWITREEAQRIETEERQKQTLAALNTAVYKIRTGSKAVSGEWEQRLGNFDDAAFAPRIVSLLDHEVPGVRRAACASLARMKQDSAIPALVKRLLIDSQESVRTAAMDALLQLDLERVCEALYAVIAEVKVATITSAGEQKAAKRLYHRIAVALGRIGDPHSVPFLTQILYPRIEIVRSNPDSTAGSWVRTLGLNRSAGDGFEAIDMTQSSTLFGTGSATALPVEEKYFFNQAAEDALRALTGQNLGVKAKDWDAWWKEHGAELLRKREAERRGSGGRAGKLIDEASGVPANSSKR